MCLALEGTRFIEAEFQGGQNHAETQQIGHDCDI